MISQVPHFGEKNDETCWMLDARFCDSSCSHEHDGITVHQTFHTFYQADQSKPWKNRLCGFWGFQGSFTATLSKMGFVFLRCWLIRSSHSAHMYAYARFFILERLQVVIITKVHRERGLGPLILEREHLYVFLVGSSFCRGLGPQNQIWHSKIKAPNAPPAIIGGI